MRIYKLTILTVEEGNRVTWHGSKKEVSKELSTNKKSKDNPYIDHDIDVVEFKPTKKGILNMLNRKSPMWDNG